MANSKSTIRDIYYTHSHEWIDFQGAVAYIGVCNFKLSGVRKINKIVFSRKGGFKNQGEVIAFIYGKDCRIPVHMPVEGKIISINDGQFSDNQNGLHMRSENDIWLALVGPAKPYERKGLMQYVQYRLFTKGKL